ncbi:MAG: T9SS type A sorting domain-containing protein [Chlorobi bacterium]|nr:T9SS type A sorting domain-containing protein [Chlorobiota bacterium]MCI0716660.1 T9SS type A sorting domain-containing protein [Chlorobiota bacterium]
MYRKFLDKRLLLVLYLSAASSAFAQFISGGTSVTFKEDLLKRNHWFYNERLFPYENHNLIITALNKRNSYREQGFSDNVQSWVSLGPSPAFYGENQFTASRVKEVVYDPDSANIIYIGTSNGGLWKSTDGGLNWEPKTDNGASLSSGALAVYNDWNTTPPQRIVYYGTGEGGFGFVYSYYGRGLLKSTDGGETWRLITNGLPPITYFFKIAVNPKSPNVLLAAVGTNYANPVNTGGLYRSTDYGESWTRAVPLSVTESGLVCNDVVFSSDGNKAYIIGPSRTGSPNWWENGTGYRISTDSGKTFTQINTNLAGTGYLSISEISPQVLYAFTAADCFSSNIYRSVDSGKTWVLMSSSFASNQCGYNMTVNVHPVNHTIVYAGTVALYRSSTSGVKFEEALPVFHADIHSLAFKPGNPNEFIVGCDGGVVKTTDGGYNFTNLNFTLSAMECYSLCSDPTEEFHLVACTQDNGLFDRGINPPPGNEWKVISGFDATSAVIDPDEPNRYIVQLSASEVGIHVSTNRGLFWFEASGLPRQGEYAWLRPIVKEPGAQGVYFTPYSNDIYESTDYGFNWSPLNSTGISDKIIELAVSPGNSNIMFAATGPFEYMPESYQHRVYKSIDGGLTWNEISSLPNRYASAIKIDKDNPDDVIISFAGFGTNHIFRTTSGGVQWTAIDCNNIEPCLPDVPVNDLEIDYDTSTGRREYFAATDIGVFRSLGDGIWREIYDGLPNCIVMDIEIHRNKLRAATFGRGVFECDLTLTPVGKSEESTLIGRTYLFPNYPNPFNPATKIKYNISKGSSVNLSVYDILGREIAVVVNKYQHQGAYEIVFDANLNGSVLSSGVYFYKLTAGEYTEIRKMVLVK